MDDFEVVLGQELMRKEKMASIPNLDSLVMFLGDNTHVFFVNKMQLLLLSKYVLHNVTKSAGMS